MTACTKSLTKRLRWKTRTITWGLHVTVVLGTPGAPYYPLLPIQFFHIMNLSYNCKNTGHKSNSFTQVHSLLIVLLHILSPDNITDYSLVSEDHINKTLTTCTLCFKTNVWFPINTCIHMRHKSVVEKHVHTESCVTGTTIFGGNIQKEKGFVVFIVVVKCFYVFASKEEMVFPEWEIFILHGGVQWALFLLISTHLSWQVYNSTRSHLKAVKAAPVVEHLY